MKKVLIYGKFNILHPGHLRLIKFAKTQGSRLVIGLLNTGNTVNPDIPIDLDERAENLQLINGIDEILGYTDVHDLLDIVKPDYVVKGYEFSQTPNPEAKYIQKLGAQLLFMSADSSYKLSVDKKSSRLVYSDFAKDFVFRHNISSEKCSSFLDQMKTLNGLVIGDLIIDEYVDCLPIGMSQEDKNIVYETLNFKRYVGGAGIVAQHCHSLGAKVKLISLIGDDQAGEYAKKFFNKIGLSADLFVEKNRATTVKKRYKWDGKSIFRASQINSNLISDKLEQKILSKITTEYENLDFIIFSDFSYGLLKPSLIEKIVKKARLNKVIISADCQTSSQVGNLNKYRNVDLITPTEAEARGALVDFNSGLAYLGQTLLEKLSSDNLILTVGSEGIIMFSKNSDELVVDRLEPLDVRTVDTSGAGDSLLAVSTLSYALSGNIALSTFLGSIAAGLHVSRLGNLPINPLELKSSVKKIFE